MIESLHRYILKGKVIELFGKKKSLMLTVVLLLVMCFGVAQNASAAIKQIKLKGMVTYKLVKGEEIKLYVKGHKKDRKVKWKSSNKKIATVSKSGKVKGKKGGSCKITAQVGKKKYKVKIVVCTGERTKHEYDSDPEPQEDRYDAADYDYEYAE